MEFDGLTTWEEIEARRIEIKNMNSRYIQLEKEELLSNGELSLAEYGRLVRNIGIYFRLPNTEKVTKKLAKLTKPSIDPLRSIKQFILKVGIKESVNKGYISIFKLHKYFIGFKEYKARKIINDQPEFREDDLRCDEEISFR